MEHLTSFPTIWILHQFLCNLFRMHLSRIKSSSEGYSRENHYTMDWLYGLAIFFLSAYSAVLLMCITKKSLWVRLFEVVSAHLKASSDQRQILTSTGGNAARADQYTELVLATASTIIPQSRMITPLKFALSCNLSCQMYNKGCADHSPTRAVSLMLTESILCVMTDR